MSKKLQSSLYDEKPKGTFRIISVEQRHERSGRVVMLLDAESMGETKTDLRKRQFTYQIQGVTDIDVKSGSWLLSPREDLGVILEVTKASVKNSKKKSMKRRIIRVRFDETGTIRLNETWLIYQNRPTTRRMTKRWQKRMTEEAIQYFYQILPGIVDSVLFKSTDTINKKQVNQILEVQSQIFRRAIQLAESQEILQLTNTQLVRATKEVLSQLERT